MAYPSITYTFVNGESNIIDANQINTNFSDIISGLNSGLRDINTSYVYTNHIQVSDSITAAGLPSGVDQGDSGAAVNELWVDTSAGNVVKRGV